MAPGALLFVAFPGTPMTWILLFSLASAACLYPSLSLRFAAASRASSMLAAVGASLRFERFGSGGGASAAGSSCTLGAGRLMTIFMVLGAAGEASLSEPLDFDDDAGAGFGTAAARCLMAALSGCSAFRVAALGCVLTVAVSLLDVGLPSLRLDALGLGPLGGFALVGNEHVALLVAAAFGGASGGLAVASSFCSEMPLGSDAGNRLLLKCSSARFFQLLYSAEASSRAGSDDALFLRALTTRPILVASRTRKVIGKACSCRSDSRTASSPFSPVSLLWILATVSRTPSTSELMTARVTPALHLAMATRARESTTTRAERQEMLLRCAKL
jgi:hypothetical protein